MNSNVELLTTARQRLLPVPHPRRLALIRLIHITAQRTGRTDVGVLAHEVLDAHHIPGEV
jgi:hypothetical protein